MASRTHGHHTGGRTPTYRSWQAMLGRCYHRSNAGWKWYGERGITVCARWRTFENFLADMGERPEGKSLDRIDPDGNYEPGNCRWATHQEQARNKRARTARLQRAREIQRLWASGMPIPEIAVEVGLGYKSLRNEMAHLRAEGFDLPYQRTPRHRASAV